MNLAQLADRASARGAPGSAFRVFNRVASPDVSHQLPTVTASRLAPSRSSPSPASRPRCQADVAQWMAMLPCPLGARSASVDTPRHLYTLVPRGWLARAGFGCINAEAAPNDVREVLGMVEVAAPPPKKYERYGETELIPSERYTSRERLKLADERRRPRVWQLAGRAEANPGGRGHRG